MIKLLIVEDEPLVQIGIQSMLSNADLNVEIIGLAKDGVQALELIDKQRPEIVITDIKMPRMDGLELLKESRKRYGKLPAFVILTSYEDFQFLREAMNYDVIDYLIKLELDQESLIKSIQKAIKNVNEHTEQGSSHDSNAFVATASFYDKFFIKLLLNLFEDEEQVSLQAKELGIDFYSHAYCVCHCEIVEYAPMWTAQDKNRLVSLYSSTIQMIRELAKKYLPCYVLSLDTKHFSIIFCFEEDEIKEYKTLIRNILEKIYSMVHNYFNVNILTSIGTPCNNPLHLSDAFQEARQIFSAVNIEEPVLFYEDLIPGKPTQNIFNMAVFKEDIKKAFEEFNTTTLNETFTQITDILKAHQAHYLQAMDAACNILFLSISLLPDGEELVAGIFAEDSDSYRSIYKQGSVDQVVEWLLYLRDGLCNCLTERKKVYKNYLITNVKKYIAAHIEEKLSLPEVASVFGISPNYLSNLFKKNGDVGFLEYITQLKIDKAKQLMQNSNLKVYEIAEHLGFESAFYFSKVFKKVEGCSPREYLQMKQE